MTHKHIRFGWIGTTLIMAILIYFSGFTLMANAETVQNFYKGKRITLLVQYGPGGSFDVQARWLARHLPRFIGVKTIVRNMPGGGGVTGYNRLYRTAPDGLTLLTAHTKLVAFDLFKRKGVKYDFTKFNFLGRAIRTNTALLISKKLPNDIAKLRKLKRIRIGASSPFNEGLMAEMLNLPLSIVPGYRGSAARMAAIMRGELDATTASVATGLRFSNAVNIAFTYRKDKKRTEIPDLKELGAKQPWQRYARSFGYMQGTVVTSPGVSSAKTKFLSNVLKKLTQDEAAKREAKKLKLVVSWTGPKKLKDSLQAFTSLDTKQIKNLKFVIERKYLGKLR